MRRNIVRVVMSLLAAAAFSIAGCGGGSGSSTTTTAQNPATVNPGTGTGDVTVTGKVAGTAFVAVDAASSTVIARHVAVVQSDGSKAFSIKIQSGKQYKFYLVENEGTSDERVFPLYIGNGNKVSVSAGTCDLGFITTTGDGIATPATTPTQFTGAVEDKTVPVGVAANQSSVYTQADLTGTWNFFVYRAGTNPSWMKATYTVDATGAATSSNVQASTGVANASNMTLAITPSGVIVNTLNATSTGSKLVMSQDKNLMVGVGNSNSSVDDSRSLFIAIKAGNSFIQSDLTGNWKMHALNNKNPNAQQGSKNFLRGDASFNANGVITVSNAFTQNGSTTTNFPTTPWVFDSTGLLNGGQGAITKDKNLIVFLVKNQDESVALGLLVRTGSTAFSSSDFTGSWRSNWLAIGATSDMWVRSLAVIGSNGSTSSYGVIANGLSEPDNTSGNTIAVSPSGLITANVTQNKIEGIMSLNKKMAIYTGLKGNNLDQFQLGILMK